MAVATLGITTTFTVTTNAVGVAVCATNTLRRGVRIENTSATATMYFAFGTNNTPGTIAHVLATSTAITLGPLGPNVTGQISQASQVPIGDLSLTALTTTGIAVVTEW
jgi:hypothetical protein